MMDKLISVIVPVYKVERYLDQCILSIVNQTYSELEVLLIDDGSPDRCAEMCDKWALIDKRIRVIHKENQGLGFARNTGMEHAKGEYVCFVDSDDYIDKNTISKAYDEIVQNNADLVVFGHYNVFANGQIDKRAIKLKKTVYTGQDIVKQLLPWMIQTDRWKECKCPFAFSAWSGIIRRDILEKYQMRFQSERVIISEDTLYLLELYSKLSVVALIPECLYAYRVNPESLTKKYRQDRQIKNDAFYFSAIDIAKKQGYSKEIFVRINMLYLCFSLEAMKHVIRINKRYKDAKTPLCEFFQDPQIKNSITADMLRKSSLPMATFFICFKCNAVFTCWLLIWLREKR